MSLTNIRRLHDHNVATLLESPLSEISGSLGDLGTLLPLMIALAVNNSISLSTTLVFSGLWNILTGVVFGIPLPVQPMKAIAAVAISRNFSIEETISAGFTTSSIVFLFSVTGLLQWFTRVIPTPVVKGIQVGAGLSLVLSAGTSLLQPLGWLTPSWADNLLWAIFAFLSLLATQKSPRIPFALIIFILGLILSLSLSFASQTQTPFFQAWHPKIYIPSWAQFTTGALQAGLGQLPLTTLNSIIAVSHLSTDLLPSVPAPSVTALGLSITLMNFVGGLFGAMPVCHGSGGLAAQYRFGARSGSSIILLGAFKILLGLLFGESLISFLRQYPKGLLGIMVLAAGIELAKVGESLNHGARDLCEESEPSLLFSPITPASEMSQGESAKQQRGLTDQERMERWSVMLMTVAGLLAFRNDGVGFLAGMLCHWANQLSKRWEGEGKGKKISRRDERWSSRRRGGRRGGGGEEEEDQFPNLLGRDEDLI